MPGRSLGQRVQAWVVGPGRLVPPPVDVELAAVPTLRGRTLGAQDTAEAPLVVVVSRAFADEGPLDEAVAHAKTDFDRIMALDEALSRLEEMDARLCRVVECRHFGGLSVPETGEALGISPATVKRDWRTARAWLKTQLDDSEPGTD